MAEKIIQRINGILKQIDNVSGEVCEMSFDEFQKQRLLPEAVCFSISQIGERMNKLEELLGDRYKELPWKEARKMRNIIIHDYDGVNFIDVYKTAINDLPKLRAQLMQIKYDIQKINENAFCTNRLMMRPWDDFDVDELFELAKDPEIGFWCGWEPHKHIRDSFFALHNFLEIKETFAICLKDNNRLLGSVGLNFDSRYASNNKECELGYWIGKPFWNKGYATEALKEIIKHAFLDLDVITMWCSRYEGNERSKHVQEKLGFQFHHIENDEDTLHNSKKVYVSILTKENWLKL